VRHRPPWLKKMVASPPPGPSPRGSRIYEDKPACGPISVSLPVVVRSSSSAVYPMGDESNERGTTGSAVLQRITTNEHLGA
jgi:hypothetical protein